MQITVPLYHHSPYSPPPHYHHSPFSPPSPLSPLPPTPPPPPTAVAGTEKGVARQPGKSAERQREQKVRRRRNILS